MKKILVTGGLGYIGSHVVVELIISGFDVIIIDDLSNSSVVVLDRIFHITGTKPIFEKIDLKQKDLVKDFFNRHSDLEGVIHFAAYKSVRESVNNPLKYYQNNINSLVYVLMEIERLKVPRFIFSSSCAVYGQVDKLPITENTPVKKVESPYGNTKKIGEEIIKDLCNINNSFNAISLRYFNPIGAHSSKKIYEFPIGVPQNLVPYLTQTAIGIREKLLIFGNDYQTPDGTCIRDYIHVVDLAKAHVVALNRLFEKKNSDNFEVFNIGTGRGYSVLDVIKSFEKATGLNVNYCYTNRRSGDVVSAYADTTKAKKILGWVAKLSLEDALASAYECEKNFLK